MRADHQAQVPWGYLEQPVAELGHPFRRGRPSDSALTTCACFASPRLPRMAA